MRLPPRKRCLVAYATPARQYLWPIELPRRGDASRRRWRPAALPWRESADGVLIPWDSAPVGVFGEPRARTAPCAHGDRIELYRAARARSARRGGASAWRASAAAPR